MADSRELTYGIGFKAGDALGTIDQIGKGFEKVEDAEKKAKSGADEVRSALNDIGSTAASVASEAGRAADGIGTAFTEAGEDSSSQFRKMGADAGSFGSAFRKTTSAAIKDGQSLAKSLQTGVSGALAYTGKKFTTFKDDFSKGAKNIGNAFRHPIETIKSKLVDALDKAERGADDLGDKSEDTGKDLKDMGNSGSNAGSAIQSAFSGALKAILGMAAIKKTIDLVKDFVGSALEAAKAGENIGAQFDRVFAGSDVEDWANNFSTAVNRSTNEVKSFLVSNKAMYAELGITGDAANELSEITTSLAYDFGNAFKMDDAEALGALQAAIQGDTSALNEFGINLDDATLKAAALDMGITKNIDQLDEATRAQVTMNAILGQSSDIQRAAAEQTGGLTNSTKSLSGIWDNFVSKAGAKFAPVMENLFNTIIKAWPKIEPALMGLVDILANGASEIIPVITELAMSLLPVLADIIQVVFEVVAPLLPVFTSLAQQILPPLAAVFGQLAQSILPPLTDIFMVLIESVLMPLLPIFEQLISALLPPFVQLLGMIAPILEMLSPILTMLAQLLVPIAQILGNFISALLPPLMTILETLFTSILQPLMPIITQLANALLPPIAALLEAIAPVLGIISPILEAISPVLEVIGTVLKVIGDVLGSIIGFFADGIGKVVGFFSNLFGGAKESEAAVDGLNESVNGLEEATNADITLEADTSSYATDITTASEDANAAAQANIIETKDISDLNLQLMGAEATSTYSTMAINAEEAWSRMVTAAEAGAQQIVAALEQIATAAASANSASAAVSVGGGGSVPGHAGGTNDFEGGWTRIHERGDELAFLPSGSAIIPADQTDRMMAGMTQNNSTSTEASSNFEPHIEVVVQGNADSGAIEEMTSKLKATVRELYNEMRQEELVDMTLKNAYA